MNTPLTGTQQTAVRGFAFVVIVSTLLICLLTLVGCSLPQWRVGQAKIDPKLAEKPAAQIEAERRSAALIADLSSPLFTVSVEASGVKPVADRLAQIHALALPLSASLGEPLKRATVFEAPNVIAATRAGLLASQQRADEWKAFAKKYAGRPIEDTGINLAGPAGLLGLVGVVAACIACPALGYLLLRVVPLLWGFFLRATAAIGEFAKSNPTAANELAGKLSNKMDAAHKALVKRRANSNRISEIVLTSAA